MARRPGYSVQARRPGGKWREVERPFLWDEARKSVAALSRQFGEARIRIWRDTLQFWVKGKNVPPVIRTVETFGDGSRRVWSIGRSESR